MYSLSTYGKPPVISYAEEHPRYLVLPRGCFDDVQQLLKEHDVELKVEDKRFRGKPIKVKFVGKLRKNQSKAVKTIRQHEIGILSAATAFGKTVVAAKMIAVRKRNTLILVHRRQLLDQWREKMALFLSIPPFKIR
jgi:superfamily II DNA or RNA helicase